MTKRLDLLTKVPLYLNFLKQSQSNLYIRVEIIFQFFYIGWNHFGMSFELAGYIYVLEVTLTLNNGTAIFTINLTINLKEHVYLLAFMN